MFRRITGLIIIISFFLVKGASLFVIEYESKNAAHHFNLEQSAKELPEENKDTKSFELMDDSIICQQLLIPMPLALSTLQNSETFQQVTTVYITLLNPPPNQVHS